MSNEAPLLLTERFQVVQVERKLPNGEIARKAVIRHPGSVVILPLLDDGQICLIRNFRMSVQLELWELPAGTLEINEPPLACAHRELIEETGFTAGNMEFLFNFFAAPGILDERMHLFLATQLTAGEPQRESTEEIANEVLPVKDALQMIKTGKIHDAKTIAGILYYQQFIQQS